MPGVPKSRGCDACRKQRKKVGRPRCHVKQSTRTTYSMLIWPRVQCDQRHPSCSRCTRLHKECSGAGVQRFTFVAHDRPQAKSKQLRCHNALEKAQAQVLKEISPNVQESNTALIVHKLSIKDLRYDISWAFGPFLSDIPKRLGRSVALETATQAFVLSLPPSPHSRRHPETDALESFTAALKATRLALAHPTDSRSMDTLCATYLLLICQVSS
jgi:hypothetical protein